MNQLIQELAEQASLELFNDTAQHRLLKGFAEKFAELLVKECAKIAGKAEYSDTWLEPVEDAIKKHFGVKE
jgi:hypothetical protein